MRDFSVEILAVGTELLLGDIANTDAQFLSRQLAGLGIAVYGHTVVGDNRARMKAALDYAFSKADMVIAVGGLGPTQDDITKEVAAMYFGRDMVLDEASMKRIRHRFQDVGLPENVHRNALVPEGSRILPNDHGSAPGCWLEHKGKTLLLLPGPPHELEPMFVNYAVPFLREKTGDENGARAILSRTLKFIGIGESTIEKRLADLFEAQTNPTLALYAKVWECHLRITASARDENAAGALISPVAEKIYERLGEYIYGEDGEELAEKVLRLCAPRTLAVAESCTGGLVSAAMVAVPGSSAVLREGLVTYSNETKIARLGVDAALLEKYGAVSAECAAAMAEGAAVSSGTDVGLSTTGIAGPGGGTPEKPVGTVYIGLYIKGRGTQTQALRLAGSRNQIRQRSAMGALHFLQRALLAPQKYRSKDHEAFCRIGAGDAFEDVGNYNIFMQCEVPNPAAFRPLPGGYRFRLCRRDELETWKRVVAEAPYIGQVTAFYERVYAPREDEFFRRCLFVCDAQDTPVASTFIWHSYGQINTVGWFRVLPGYEGLGLGRALLGQVLKGAEFPIFLHTQPTSARAIKLYSDFGFKLITGPMPGRRPNDLEKSLPFLQKVLPPEDYALLQFTEAHPALLAAIQSREGVEY